MRHITEQAKQAIITKALSNNGQTMTEIAKANNIGCSTLSRWVSDFKSGKQNGVKKTAAAIPITTLAERFKHLQATVDQEDAIVGAYCREHGLYPHQLTEWEADFMTPTVPLKNNQNSAEVKELRTELNLLKRIIARKDKVLAETVALLVLKKKAAHIWGEDEED